MDLSRYAGGSRQKAEVEEGTMVTQSSRVLSFVLDIDDDASTIKLHDPEDGTSLSPPYNPKKVRVQDLNKPLPAIRLSRSGC